MFFSAFPAGFGNIPELKESPLSDKYTTTSIPIILL